MRSCCLDKGMGYDERGCHAVVLDGCQAGIQAVWDGEAVFQPVAAECFDAQADLFAKCENVSLEERLARTSFVFGQCLAFRGRREPGEACRGHFDCAQANAHSAWTYCDGVCRVASLTPLGASCRLGEACVPGAYCRPRLPGAVHGMCEPTFELGQPCDPASDAGACGYAARCDAARHACVAADRLVGELCTAHDECISGRCESALGFRCASAQPEIGALGCGTSNHARTTSPSL